MKAGEAEVVEVDAAGETGLRRKWLPWKNYVIGGRI